MTVVTGNQIINLLRAGFKTTMKILVKKLN